MTPAKPSGCCAISPAGSTARRQHGCDTMGRFSERVAYLIELLEGFRVEPALDQIVDQRLHDGGVLGCSLDQTKRMRKRMQRTPSCALRTKRRKFGLANFEPNCWKR